MHITAEPDITVPPLPCPAAIVLPDAEVAFVVGVLKALAGPIRLRLLRSLEHQEHSVGKLTEQVGAPYAVVSQHLARLRATGLVTVRRSGTRMLYRSANPHVSALLAAALHLAAQPAPPESSDLAGTDLRLAVTTTGSGRRAALPGFPG
ncbi:ArsR/SmtB family transcription factor [Streptomyces sp. NPDC006692]|uniref:ArsR/SmtB family transcription factor n=1 Tax=Streptomyces sp. NPDC006692 TaxID=3364758 RepID=UPI0036CED64C